MQVARTPAGGKAEACRMADVALKYGTWMSGLVDNQIEYDREIQSVLVVEMGCVDVANNAQEAVSRRS